MKKILLLSMIALVSSCQKFETIGEVIIGNQIWATKNLDIDKFNNGDVIPEAKTNNEWNLANINKTPAWCNFDNDEKNGAKYGKLYNWYAVIDPRGIAPKGWHVPSKSEWLILLNNLGGGVIAGNKMKSSSGWDYSGNGNNESNFLGLPGGFRFDNGDFGNIGNLGNFWSTTTYLKSMVEVLNLDNGSPEATFFLPEKGFGMSIRCLKNNKSSRFNFND
jgi:uncharacterized protein (TIGR02145 family)